MNSLREPGKNIYLIRKSVQIEKKTRKQSNYSPSWQNLLFFNGFMRAFRLIGTSTDTISKCVCRIVTSNYYSVEAFVIVLLRCRLSYGNIAKQTWCALHGTRVWKMVLLLSLHTAYYGRSSWPTMSCYRQREKERCAVKTQVRSWGIANKDKFWSLILYVLTSIRVQCSKNGNAVEKNEWRMGIHWMTQYTQMLLLLCWGKIDSAAGGVYSPIIPFSTPIQRAHTTSTDSHVIRSPHTHKHTYFAW